MPRKTSQAKRKDTSVDSKNEGVTPRRSGRAVTKQESSSEKDASRSRRSSTAAQTAASVADSKSPKGRSSISSRRESTSPSDSRTRSGREGVESPATRVKATRRNASRINYKESDGEEEAAAPKFDENFNSGEEFEESESDEAPKPQEKNKPVRAVVKGRGSKEKVEIGSRGRRGRRSTKIGEDEEVKAFDVSDESMEPEVVATKPARSSIKEKEPPKPRGRRQRAEVIEVKPETKPSRRSSRAASTKEESPKKRPARSVQAKRYAEDEEEEIEEIVDTKVEDETKQSIETESTRKRKRGPSPEGTSKRKKEDDQQEEEDENNDKEENIKESVVEEEKPSEEKETSIVEPMEVDESDSGIVSQGDSKSQDMEEETKVAESKEDTVIKEQESEKTSPSKETPAVSNEPSGDNSESLDNSENLDESPQCSDSEPEKDDLSISPESEDLQSTTENIKEAASDEKLTEEPVKETAAVAPSMSPEKIPPVVATSESLKQSPAIDTDTPSKPEKVTCTTEVQQEVKKTDAHSNDVSTLKESETVTESPTLNTVKESSPAPSSVSDQQKTAISIHSAEVKPDPPLNGAENISDSVITAPTPQISNANLEHTDNIPKANGSHELHTNLTPLPEQHYLLPGRKYVINSKLKENVLQSFKNEAFGFLSYNLGSDMCVQKEKLLNELNKLNSHIICLQQVPKPFYTAVLEPTLDALGYKSLFSQPEDSLKGMATFYKNSQFKLCGHSEASLKKLIDKELETHILEAGSRAAVKSYIKKCGNVLFTQFTSVLGSQAVVVANVQIPPSDLSSHALQVSCLAREVIRINGGSTKPLLIGGEFNIAENDVSYQLLKDGYLSNDMIDELQRRKDIIVPEKENSSLLDLLWKSFQHPSSNLCSCYRSVLDHELVIPEIKTASPDLLWYTSGSLHTVGVLDVVSGKPGDRHYSLKADIAFSV